MLRTTLKGLHLIEAFESLKTRAYRCPAGIWTIGVGHTSAAGGMFTLTDGSRVAKVGPGQTITGAEAHRLFSADIDAFENEIEKLIVRARIEPSKHEFDALVSLAFNIGIGNFSGSTVLRKFNAGDRAGAADAFLSWNKASVNGRKVVVKGLVRRREAERWYFLGDLELAGKIAQTDLGAMPREVSAPQKRETMARSATGNTALVTGATGFYAAFEGVKQAVSTGQDVRDTIAQAGEFVTGAGGSPWALMIGAGIVVAIGAAIIWYRRWRRSKDDEVVEADPGVIVRDLSDPPPNKRP